ncbi:hypothetical protein P43SY_000020 [Pythium insidiosum]|uniref:DNA sliding clamp PCNA n=1 Tax=Pythium insidiosum TaxID=114742 RepID=A0AAD5Q811_PYTIN|nr:hypothetical protein P43SY_000020 [Pythium insidiosum]
MLLDGDVAADMPSLEFGDKVVLPAIRAFGADDQSPETASPRHQYCSVQEFSAPDGQVFAPYWMMQNLQIDEGQFVVLTLQPDVPRGIYCRLEPEDTTFLDLAAEIGPKLLMESALRRYSVLSVEETILIDHGDQRFYLRVVELKPAAVVSLLGDGRIFKLIVEAMKDLISEGNIDCTKSGIALQSMDGSHVSLVSLLLRAEGFEHYRCDRNISLGIQTASLSKILKCSGNDDALSLSADDNGDALNIMFEAASGDRVSDFSLKLMDIDSEHLGIPGTEYMATVRMPAAEFQRICRDLQTMGDTCTIAVGKEGVKFSVSGDLGAGNITLKNNTAAEKESDRVIITMEEPVELTFALRYLNMFAKATPLSETVTLSMSPGIPIVVEYPIGDIGYMRFYLAPKVEEED